MAENERQQRVVERIQEDERLRGDLEDDAAAALISWAVARVAAAAADPARPDPALEADVQAVRSAARSAARSGESEPERLVALAEAALAGAAAPDASGAPAAVPAAVASEPAHGEIGQTPGEQGMAPAASAEAPAAPSPPEQPGAAEKIAGRRRRPSRIAALLRHLRGRR